jgi:hypothetical protein
LLAWPIEINPVVTSVRVQDGSRAKLLIQAHPRKARNPVLIRESAHAHCVLVRVSGAVHLEAERSGLQAHGHLRTQPGSARVQQLHLDYP